MTARHKYSSRAQPRQESPATFAKRYLLERFEIIDMALRVGGIGSVGTRCFVILLKGGADDDALILQLKEAGPSVLEAYVSRKSSFDNHAHRVVNAQHLMQATSDIFLTASILHGLLPVAQRPWLLFDT